MAGPIPQRTKNQLVDTASANMASIESVIEKGRRSISYSSDFTLVFPSYVTLGETVLSRDGSLLAATQLELNSGQTICALTRIHAGIEPNTSTKFLDAPVTKQIPGTCIVQSVSTTGFVSAGGIVPDFHGRRIYDAIRWQPGSTVPLRAGFKEFAEDYFAASIADDGTSLVSGPNKNYLWKFPTGIIEIGAGASVKLTNAEQNIVPDVSKAELLADKGVFNKISSDAVIAVGSFDVNARDVAFQVPQPTYLSTKNLGEMFLLPLPALLAINADSPPIQVGGTVNHLHRVNSADDYVMGGGIRYLIRNQVDVNQAWAEEAIKWHVNTRSNQAAYVRSEPWMEEDRKYFPLTYTAAADRFFSGEAMPETPSRQPNLIRAFVDLGNNEVSTLEQLLGRRGVAPGVAINTVTSLVLKDDRLYITWRGTDYVEKIDTEGNKVMTPHSVSGISGIKVSADK